MPDPAWDIPGRVKGTAMAHGISQVWSVEDSQSPWDIPGRVQGTAMAHGISQVESIEDSHGPWEISGTQNDYMYPSTVCRMQINSVERNYGICQYFQVSKKKSFKKILNSGIPGKLYKDYFHFNDILLEIPSSTVYAFQHFVNISKK